MDALPIVKIDGAGDDLPVGLGKAAVGHGAVDDAVIVLAGLEQHAGGEQKGRGGGVDDGTCCVADALGAGDVVKAGGVHVEAHVAVGGVDEHVVGSARNLQMAFGLKLRGGLVVDDLVGAEDVVA